MKYDAVILDIDGTLWNASAASAEGWNEGLARLGINRTVTPEDISSVAGRPYAECVEILFPGLQNRYPGLLDVLDSCETEKVKETGGRFFEGVIEGVKALSERYKIGLVSNCQDWYMDLFLKFSGFLPVLTDYDCHGFSGRSKAEMLGGMRDRHNLLCPVYVGDTAGDEKSAVEAGMDFMFVSYGFGSPEGSPMKFDSFTGLTAYLT